MCNKRLYPISPEGERSRCHSRRAALTDSEPQTEPYSSLIHYNLEKAHTHYPRRRNQCL